MCLGLGANEAHSILFTALFGLFGKMFIHANTGGDSGIQTMKNAVWVDLGKI